MTTMQTEPITNEALEELRRLREQATPGPLKVCGSDDGKPLHYIVSEAGIGTLIARTCFAPASEANASLHCALHNAFPALCARIEAEEERARKLERDVQEAKFSPLGDNHHNAMKCPHCNPDALDPKALRASLTQAEGDRDRLTGLVKDAFDAGIECATDYIERVGDYGTASKIGGIQDAAYEAWDKFKVQLSATPPSVGRENWRDIATAPKDGSEILGWREDCGTLLIRWTSPAEFLTQAELDALSLNDANEEDWFYADFVSGGRLEGDEAPTHWMPLPPAPALTTKPTGRE